MAVNENEGQTTTDFQDTPETPKTEIEQLRMLAVKQTALLATAGRFYKPEHAATVLADRLTFDAASGEVKGLDGRSVLEHVQSMFEDVTHKGNPLPERRVTPEQKAELTILSKSDCSTPDEKSAFITARGFAAWERLPLNVPRGDGQILAKSDLVTPQAKAAWISTHPGEYEGLPLKRKL